MERKMDLNRMKETSTDILKVSIIILNWNGKDDTIECVESIKKITYSNYEIYIIDNDSKDGSYDYFKNHYPDLEIIQTGKNLGYSEGNNVGIRKSLENGTDYILILNNDTIVDPNFLNELVVAAESDDTIGILGPKTYYSHPKNMIYFAGSKINWILGQPRHIGQKKIDTGQFDVMTETDFIAGSCMLIRRVVFEKIGLFPTDYFLLWEDIDYSIQAKKNGFKNLYVPKAKIWHKVSASIKKMSGSRMYFSARNRMIFIRKHSKGFHKVTSISWYIFYYGPLSITYNIICSNDLKDIKNTYYFLKGVMAGLFYRI